MNISRKQSIRAFAVALIVVGVTAAEGAWVVTEIPQQSGWSGDTSIFDINDSGVVCGIGNYVSGVSVTAFRYDGIIITELPYLHPSPATYQYANASAINSSGVIAGRAHNADGTDRAVFWTGSTITEIPVPTDINTCGVNPDDDDMRGYGINDAGVVVGYYLRNDGTVNGIPTAFYYDGTTHSLLTALQAAGLGGGRSYAYDVNNNGLVCGEAEDAAGDYVFFTYDVSTGTATSLGKVTPYVGTDYTTAAINDDGHIAGRGKIVPWENYRALLHDGTNYHEVDDSTTRTIPEWSSDVNNAGRVVGNTDTASNRWAWYSNAPGSNSMQRVDLSGWNTVSLEGVNASDVMVGYGETATSGGNDRGFIVSPPPGDFNHDGGVDLTDFAQFVACISGPKEGPGFVAPSEACLEAFDLTPSAENYTVTEIPFLPTWSGVAEAFDINSSGVVCGNGNYVINTSSTPFRYDGFTVTELDILPDADVPIALVTAINADGVICGYSHEADTNSRAVYWEDTAVIALPYPADMNTACDFRAYDINDNNVIVGYYYSTNGVGNNKTAFYYDGAMHSLGDTIRNAGLTGGYQSASGINNNNVISGSADAFGTHIAWTYNIAADVLTVIGTIIPFKDCSATDINESGQTIGRSRNAFDRYRAVTYDGTWHFVDDLLDRTQFGKGINDNGRMVGYNYRGGNIYEGWYSDGPGDGSIVVLDLSSGWTSASALSINNDNVIAGYGKTSVGDGRGFICTPVPGDGDIDLEDFAAFQVMFEGS